MFYDYPHFGVWPDGYYMGPTASTAATSLPGPGAMVFDRAKMLSGQPATYQEFNAEQPPTAPCCPPTWTGRPLPPAGAPNYFASLRAASTL